MVRAQLDRGLRDLVRLTGLPGRHRLPLSSAMRVLARLLGTTDPPVHVPSAACAFADENLSGFRSAELMSE